MSSAGDIISPTGTRNLDKCAHSPPSTVFSLRSLFLFNLHPVCRFTLCNMSDSNNNETKQPSIPSHNEDPAPPADSRDQGVLDTVKSQINSTGNSLMEIGNETSAMAGESFNEVKKKVGSISPGEVYNNVCGQAQSITPGDNGNQQDEEPKEHRMFLPHLNLSLSFLYEVQNC